VPTVVVPAGLVLVASAAVAVKSRLHRLQNNRKTRISRNNARRHCADGCFF
jgi:hypothetical protein